MQNQHIPVLIFAQSGRFLAQSAMQAGYTVWVTDCFGDQDTLEVADRWQSLPPFSALTHEFILATLAQITQGEQCILICGSGIEACYSFLDYLPSNIKFIGNATSIIKTIKEPTLFFKLLDQLNIAYPETQFKPPSDKINWLSKSNSGLGGSHIQYLDHVTSSPNTYYQRLITGDSGSGLFLANGKKAKLISHNKHAVSANQATPFRLGTIESPWNISTQHQQTVEDAINKLTIATKLKGFNSLDFIISDHNELLILEVNPRPSASLELLTDNQTVFNYHIDACHGGSIILTQNSSTTRRSLRYLYAKDNVTIPINMNWPNGCHDLPVVGSIINKNEPICTSIVQLENNPSANNCHQKNERFILQKLLTRA